MDFIDFKKQFIDFGVVTPHQICSVLESFDRSDIGHWSDMGLMIKLRNGHYAFSDFLKVKDFKLAIANKILQPSYLSMQSALKFHGALSSSSERITSVTCGKQVFYSNDFGEFAYHKISENMMFGAIRTNISNGFHITIATAEKALIDLIQLCPYCDKKEKFDKIGLDENFMKNKFNVALFKEYLEQININSLSYKCGKLLKHYGFNKNCD